jgi:PRTRC genetic system protein F
VIGQPSAALALPQLDAQIPMRYTIPSADAFTIPLTIALLEAGVISDAMLRARHGATLVEVFSGEDEKELAMRALSRWWAALIHKYSCKFFRWSLHVQQLDGTRTGHSEDNAAAWFCFTRMDEPEIPRFALAKGIERLEAVLEGFGQTVLAVLFEATLLLPDSLNPWAARDWVEMLHWEDSQTDEELLENYRELNGYASVEQVIEEDALMTRALFYASMPRWVCQPSQVLSREAIGAAGTGQFERSVIEVCDALHALVSRPEFILRPWHKGAHRCGLYSVDGSMVLLWKEGDTIGQVIDDYLNWTGESGEYCEFIDANPVPMTADGIREFQTLTEQMMQVAVLTEQLLLLLGEKF